VTSVVICNSCEVILSRARALTCFY
jgi:hypothetical protein